MRKDCANDFRPAGWYLPDRSGYGERTPHDCVIQWLEVKGWTHRLPITGDKPIDRGLMNGKITKG